MKNKIFQILIVLFIFAGVNSVGAFEPILDGGFAVYNPSAKTFSANGIMQSRIVLNKKSVAGHSQYYAPNGKLVLKTGGDFEFVHKGALVSIHNSELKYYKIVFEEGCYKEIEIPADELYKYFPDTQIVKISDFKDNAIILSKPYLKKVQFLLYNDTNKDFENYTFSVKKMNKNDIKGLINASSPKVIKFSSCKELGENSSVLKIIIKNQL